MLVVTNYPQVPIATTNAATDSARVESQQRPPIIPAPQLAKSNEERPFNPQNERAADQANIQAKLNEKVQAKQQGQGQHQQEGQQQQQQAKQGAAAIIRPLMMKPALARRDIRSAQTETPREPQKPKTRLENQASSFYQSVSAHIASFYQTQTLPKGEPELSTFI
ncbi:hypothetical protein SHLO109777_15870 [Shewanella loihica]|uniref:Uncharacterized protein n=1 Tax=Shewanella loihica (strain ATCC BAA-1088 / PV-4) TaxID=323850 RepID=A3QJ49_SHELP|nr:hypothetical protein [Shewanella loihica]ABO25497.1 conserved hypothetical protein [Shewanella loihica PV-4]